MLALDNEGGSEGVREQGYKGTLCSFCSILRGT